MDLVEQFMQLAVTALTVVPLSDWFSLGALLWTALASFSKWASRMTKRMRARQNLTATPVLVVTTAALVIVTVSSKSQVVVIVLR